MPKLVFSSEKHGCGATIEVDSQETCLVSVSQSGVDEPNHDGPYKHRYGAYPREGAYSGMLIVAVCSDGKKTQRANNCDSQINCRVAGHSPYDHAGIRIATIRFG
jgi:hypothetical protein